jgi:hypothetical protein
MQFHLRSEQNDFSHFSYKPGLQLQGCLTGWQLSQTTKVVESAENKEYA